MLPTRGVLSRQGTFFDTMLPVRFLLALALVLALGATSYLFLRGDAGPEGADAAPQGLPPAVVELAEVKPESLKLVYEIPGTLRAEMSVEVKSEIEGIVAEIGFQEGQGVKQGLVLFRLRDSAQRALLNEARASLALAKAIHERTKVLTGRDVASAAQLDSAFAELAVAKARVELAKVNLDRTIIRAPFDGSVGARIADIGDRIGNEDPLVRIDALDRLQLVFSVVEAYAARIEPGIPVQIRVAPYPGEIFHGEVYFISPALDATLRRLPIKAWVPNPDHRLRPGLFAKINAELGEKLDALMIPESALVYDLEGSFVWTVDENNQAHRNPVEVGFQRDGQLEVLAGLEAGARIVISGVHKVTDGFMVVPSPSAAARAAEANGQPESELDES